MAQMSTDGPRRPAGLVAEALVCVHNCRRGLALTSVVRPSLARAYAAVCSSRPGVSGWRAPREESEAPVEAASAGYGCHEDEGGIAVEGVVGLVLADGGVGVHAAGDALRVA